MTIDIIIPTTFEPDLTYGLIESIKQHDMGEDFHICVVDNGSSPKFEYEWEKLKTIRVEHRLSFAKAMNAGINNTESEYILLLNNDTLIKDHGFLKNLKETIDSDEKIGIVSPMTNFICVEAAKIPDKTHLKGDILEYNGHIAAVCFLLKRDIINEIGLFDENFENSHSDGDFCERILRAEYKIYIDRRTFLFHYGSRTISRTKGYYEAFGKNSNYYHTKWKI